MNLGSVYAICRRLVVQSLANQGQYSMCKNKNSINDITRTWLSSLTGVRTTISDGSKRFAVLQRFVSGMLGRKRMQFKPILKKIATESIDYVWYLPWLKFALWNMFIHFIFTSWSRKYLHIKVLKGCYDVQLGVVSSSLTILEIEPNSFSTRLPFDDLILAALHGPIHPMILADLLELYHHCLQAFLPWLHNIFLLQIVIAIVVAELAVVGSIVFSYQFFAK